MTGREEIGWLKFLPKVRWVRKGGKGRSKGSEKWEPKVRWSIEEVMEELMEVRDSAMTWRGATTVATMLAGILKYTYLKTKQVVYYV